MLRLVVGATLLALTLAGGVAVAAHKTVTLTVDGTQMTVATMKSRVIDVVKENGFDVGEHDDLLPAADAEVHQSDSIVLRRSRPLQLSLDVRVQSAVHETLEKGIARFHAEAALTLRESCRYNPSPHL